MNKENLQDLGLCNLKSDIHRYILSTELFLRLILGVRKLKSKTEHFVSCLFFMHLYSFSILRVQINGDCKNFDNTFGTLLALISKWKPFRRVFHIIKALICL